jgi:hypothetical protein
VLQCRAGDGKGRAGDRKCGAACGALTRVRSPHIGILFSGLAPRVQLAFFEASPDSIISAH